MIYITLIIKSWLYEGEKINERGFYFILGEFKHFLILNYQWQTLPARWEQVSLHSELCAFKVVPLMHPLHTQRVLSRRPPSLQGQAFVELCHYLPQLLICPPANLLALFHILQNSQNLNKFLKPPCHLQLPH